MVFLTLLTVANLIFMLVNLWHAKENLSTANVNLRIAKMNEDYIRYQLTRPDVSLIKKAMDSGKLLSQKICACGDHRIVNGECYNCHSKIQWAIESEDVGFV